MDADSLALSIVVCFLLFLVSQVEGQNKLEVSALYIFGDSTIDPGNNNGLVTLVKSNFPPYGRDFPNGQPTGRFTNGRLATDILSGLVGLPDIIPAALDTDFTGKKLLTGASFGSSAAGYADSTSETLNVIPLQKQVDLFRDYRAKLNDFIGVYNGNRIISQAMFFISMGTNDFANNYYINPLTRKKYNIEQFQELLIASLGEFVKSLYAEGSTRLAIIGLPPFGCLPSQITLHNLIGNACVQEFNQVARSFNSKIKALVEDCKARYPGLRVAYIDIYNSLNDIIQDPWKYGFEETRKGCCGTGLLETAILCNKASPVCPDPSKYVFWDSFHPTTTTYTILAKDVFRQVEGQIL